MEQAILAALDEILAQAPFRRMITPGGFEMSVAMTNCGAAGWVTDRRGYRYHPVDPVSGQPWPAMPARFGRLAKEVAAEAGFEGFTPDACLINCYEPGTRLSLHQNKDEGTTAIPSSRYHWGYPPSSSSAVPAGATRPCGCRSAMAISWSGVGRRGCSIMGPAAERGRASAARTSPRQPDLAQGAIGSFAHPRGGATGRRAPRR